MNQAELTAYVCGKIDGAAVALLPFQHLIIRDFWPESFYAQLLEHMPAGDDWKRRGDYGMGGRTLMASRANSHPLWQTCYDVLESESFMQTLCRKWKVDDGMSRCLLHKDLNGYGISPHTDAVSKRVAYVLYCAPKELRTSNSMIDIDICNAQQNGTALLELQSCIGSMSPPMDDRHDYWYNYRVREFIPYLPNILLSWPRSRTSFHSVDIRFSKESKYQARYSIRGFIFDPDADLPFIFQEDERERYAASQGR